jgi:hypothetical protein
MSAQLLEQNNVFQEANIKPAGIMILIPVKNGVLKFSLVLQCRLVQMELVLLLLLPRLQPVLEGQQLAQMSAAQVALKPAAEQDIKPAGIMILILV